MKILNKSKFILLASILALVSLLTTNSAYADKCKKKHKSATESFTQKMQFQLFDAYGYQVENTKFWATVKVEKLGDRIFLSFPNINFETGQIAAEDPFPNIFSEFELLVLQGGTLRTINGFLPERFCPTQAFHRSYLVPTNNGQTQPFSYLTTDFSELPTPSDGYILSVNFFGAVIIEGMGTFDNLIAPGPQIMPPTDVSYIHEGSKTLSKNTIVGPGFSDVTQFTDANSINDAYRDSQVNDAYKGITAWSWGDNSMVADKTNNTFNTVVAVGKVKNGKLQAAPPIQLTNLAPNVTANFDHSVAINRTDIDNIVVGYSVFDRTVPSHFGTYYRAASFDGGKTWPSAYNGPLQLGPPYQKSGGFDVGDARGVASDKFGNIWYSGAIRYTGSGILQPNPPGPGFINDIPFWAVSNDGGKTFYPVYTIPTTAPFNITTDYYDYPQFCFGEDGNGNYGMWYVSDYYPNGQTFDGIDVINLMGFVPIKGPTTTTSIVGSISGTTLTITKVLSGTVTVGQVVTNSWGASTTIGVAPNTIIKAPIAVNPNGTGTYKVSSSDPKQKIPAGFNLSLISGIGTVSASTPTFLTSLLNVQVFGDITASQDGRVWTSGSSNILTCYNPSTLRFKSPPNSTYPDPISSNYAGTWQVITTNNFATVDSNINVFFGPSGPFPFVWDSYPLEGYFNSVKTVIFDDKRQALYALFVQNTPDLSQNMRLYLLISRNNGETWSNPIYINTANFANRGFQSMALDTATGDLVFGWYDGRNDPKMTAVQYFGSVLPAKKLDKLVNEIQVSNPLFVTPPATGIVSPETGISREQSDKIIELKKRLKAEMMKKKPKKGIKTNNKI